MLFRSFTSLYVTRLFFDFWQSRGWLTKLSAPIVVYDDRQTAGIRFPFDIPVEDFLFGFALVTAVLLLWERQRERR